jgi:hypothetical protein
MKRPGEDEYNPFFSRYIKLVPGSDFMQLLGQQTADTVNFMRSIPKEKYEYRYAQGKWTTKQILMHLIDTEKVMNYRALAAARGDIAIVLPNMDEDLYAANADVTSRSMESLLEEFEAVRTVTEIFYGTLETEASQRKAFSETNGVKNAITARAVGYIIIGHVMHHLNTIRERYL